MAWEVSQWRVRESGHEGCMDECIWNHTHHCKGFLEDHKLLRNMYEITISLCDNSLSSHGSIVFSPEDPR